jgi:hypothetical protein
LSKVKPICGERDTSSPARPIISLWLRPVCGMLLLVLDRIGDILEGRLAVPGPRKSAPGG